MECRPLNAPRALIVLLGIAASAVHAAPFVYVTQPASVAVIDAATNLVTATIPVGDFPYGIAITRSGALGYTADFAGDTVTFLDLTGNHALGSVPVAAQPLALALSADETRLFVASRTSRLTVIDTASRATTAIVPLIDRPIALALHPDGKRLYVLYEGVAFVGVFDTVTNTLAANLDNRLDVLPGGFALRPSGAEIYVANEYMRSFFLPPPSDIVTIIDTSAATPVASMAVGEQVSAVTFGSNPERAYVATSNHVKVIDPATRTVVDSIPVAAGYSPAIAYLPALHRIYLTSYSGNVVTVIDTATASALTTIPVTGPGYIAVVPDAVQPVNTGPQPALSVSTPRPRKPVVAPRIAPRWTN